VLLDRGFGCGDRATSSIKCTRVRNVEFSTTQVHVHLAQSDLSTLKRRDTHPFASIQASTSSRFEGPSSHEQCLEGRSPNCCTVSRI
jgi:hypothetical protein